MSVGTIYPKGTMLLRRGIGSAEVNDDGITLYMSLANLTTPCVESPSTGKYFVLSWSEIIDLAIAAGILNDSETDGAVTHYAEMPTGVSRTASEGDLLDG